MGKFQITAKGLAALEEGMADLKDGDVRLLALKMLEVLARDGEMSEEECLRKALAETRGNAPQALPRNLA